MVHTTVGVAAVEPHAHITRLVLPTGTTGTAFRKRGKERKQRPRVSLSEGCRRSKPDATLRLLRMVLDDARTFARCTTATIDDTQDADDDDNNNANEALLFQ